MENERISKCKLRGSINKSTTTLVAALAVMVLMIPVWRERSPPEGRRLYARQESPVPEQVKSRKA